VLPNPAEFHRDSFAKYAVAFWHSAGVAPEANRKQPRAKSRPTNGWTMDSRDI